MTSEIARPVPGNRLGNETSPYLLQHKDNPVHWWPWGPEALAEARRRDVPVLLSVGYAACHWCHVMAHESFESAAIAARMNDLFVNIKVDREERPDLDAIYQSALALLGEHGGWPLTMFLTPDGEPFWGGTYFPPEPRFGRPGFGDVLDGVARIYREEREKVDGNVTALRDALARLEPPRAEGDLPPDLVEQVARRLVDAVDRTHGGVGGAPKFPQAPIFELFLEAWRGGGETRYLEAVTLTIDRMAQGGIYDHLGGGFARYATDPAWLVPHFEKMLYDNAQMIDLLLEGWKATDSPLHEARLRETVDWVLREMAMPEGGFAGTLDADSEGEEGRFYVWSEAEIDSVLGADAALFKNAYDVRPGGNWEGRTILNRSDRPEPGDADSEARLAACRARLLEVRDRRVRPGLDDKILADWNGLMIAALARAADVFGETAWHDAAVRAYNFVRTSMSDGDRLHHTWRCGRAAHPGTLDDYAAMMGAALALHESTGDTAYLDDAGRWFATVEAHFRDPEGRAYFFSASDVDDVIARTKTAYDNATPSGNGLLAEALVRLHLLTGERTHLARAEEIFRTFAGEASRNILPLATWILAWAFAREPLQVVVVGDRADDDTAALLDAVRRNAPRRRVLQVVAPDEALPAGHPAAGKGQQDSRATAYVCRGPVCSLPVTTPADLAALLAPRPR